MTGARRSRMILKPAFWGCLALVLPAIACNQQTPADARAADAQAIRDLDAKWAKTAASKDLESTVSYYTDDAVLLPPNEPIASGKEAIRASWKSLLDATISLSWHATTVDVSRSGDLAYLVGTYELTMKDAKGKPVEDKGKLIEIFRKQADGTWKTVADMYNSDLPPTV